MLSVCVTHCSNVVEAGVLHDLTPHLQVSDVVIPGSDAVTLESNPVRCGNLSYQ